MKSNSFVFDKHIGNNIRKYRKRQNFTQVSLSELLGISSQQVQKYESGKNKISVNKLVQISQILEVPFSSFLIIKDGEQEINYNYLEAPVNDVERLIYFYSMIKSQKVRDLIISNSKIFVEYNL